jgi:hypothetical protein
MVRHAVEMARWRGESAGTCVASTGGRDSRRRRLRLVVTTHSTAWASRDWSPPFIRATMPPAASRRSSA